VTCIDPWPSALAMLSPDFGAIAASLDRATGVAKAVLQWHACCGT